MRSTKGVIDINITQAGEFLGKCGVVDFFLGVITHVFQKQDVAFVQLGNLLFHSVSDGFIGELDRASDHLGELHGDGAERHGGLALAIGAA